MTISESRPTVMPITTLEWPVGIYCAAVGALMLVSPHQFGGPVFADLQGALLGMGILWLLAGLAIVGHRIVGASVWWEAATHAAVAAALLTFTYNALRINAAAGGATYLILALGTFLEPLVSRRLSAVVPRSADFFALTLELRPPWRALSFSSYRRRTPRQATIWCARGSRSMPSGSFSVAARSHWSRSFGLLLLAVAASVVAGILIARRLTRPLSGLVAASTGVAAGSRAISLAKAGGSEIEKLVAAFDEMSDPLAERTAELEHQRARWQATIEGMAEAVMVCDADGRTVYLNDGLRHMIRTIVDATVEFADAELPYGIGHTDGDPFGGLWWQIRRVVQTGVAASDIELVWRTSDRLHFAAVFNVSPLPNASGQVIDVVAVGRDVTRMRQLEEDRERLLTAEQQARASAESAVRIRDEFLSVGAHELKTLVTAVRGFAQLFRRRSAGGDESNPGQIAVIAAEIDRQSARLTALVNQLLDLSRIEAGKLMLDRRPTNVGTVADETVATFRSLHPNRQFELAIDGPSVVQADGIRLTQVLTNLLDNAVKFSPRDAPVETTITRSVPGGVDLAIRDHGNGIPAETRERIFERFFQVNDGVWRGGLGLGLYVSRQIVELHGGTIRVECPDDRGTRVIVRLPVGETDPENEAVVCLEEG